MTAVPETLTKALAAMRADYLADKNSQFVRRRTGLPPQGGSADYHNRRENLYYDRIEKARDMDRNDAIVGQLTDRAVSNIVQEGFSLDIKTGDRFIDRDLMHRWEHFANSPENCDLAGELVFSDFESAIMRAIHMDGDCGVSGTFEGHLQFLEAHSIRNDSPTDPENTVLGVELNRFRKRIRYWIQTDKINPNRSEKELAIPLDVRSANGVRQFFHAYSPKRTTLTRGVTAYAPIFELTGMLEDINFAKLVQQQIVSCFAIIREMAPGAGGGPPPSTSSNYGAQTTETTTTGDDRIVNGVAPGMEVKGLQGEKITGFSPNIPNAEYFEQYKLILQIISVNLGLPLCLALMDGSETNFSGWRGAVDEARKGFKKHQRNLIKRFHTPVYLWKLSQWIAEDSALRTVGGLSGIDLACHNWNAPTWPYIEPVKDAAGDLLRVRNGLISQRRLHAERNHGDWDEISTEIVEDNALAIVKARTKAQQINNQFQGDNQPVHWRELISLPTPDGVSVAIQPQNEGQSALGGGNEE